MKKIKLLFYFLLLVLSCTLSNGQSWMWGRQGNGGTKYNDFGSSVATDKHGNAYVAKQYLTQITFGKDTLRGTPYDNMYLIKYNSAGVLKWAWQPYQSSQANCFANSVATDNSGNILVAGDFSDTVRFGTFTLYGHSISSYVAKFDSNGNVIWAVQSSNPGIVFTNSIATDEKSNSYITGYFYYEAYFGSYSLSDPYFPLWEGTPYIVKYDANGNVLWAEQGYCASNTSYGTGNSISTDKNGNSFITGFFTDTISFGSQSLYSKNAQNTNGNIFLAKYDSNGNFVWAKQAKTPSEFSYGVGYAVTTDRLGNPYISGYFKDTMAFGATTLVAKDSDMFLAKYDPSGNELWAEQSAQGVWMGFSMATDARDNIYLGGIGDADTLTFGGNSLHNFPGKYSSFILKLTTSGNFICGSMLVNGGGTGRNYIGIASDSTGQYLYEAGDLFEDTVFCTDTLIAASGGTAPYVVRWQNCDQEQGISPIQASTSSLTLFPNPNNGAFTIQSSVASGKSSVEIYNVLGEKVYSQCNIQNPTFNIDLSSPQSGIYLYRILSESGTVVGSGKFMIQ